MRSCSIFIALILALYSASALAEEAYYRVPLNELDIVEGELPTEGWIVFSPNYALPVYARIDGPGEIYAEVNRTFHEVARLRDEGAIVCITPEKRDISGRLHILSELDGEQKYNRIAFTIPAESASLEAEQSFYRAKSRHYHALIDGWDATGAAWFRRQYLQARGDEEPGLSSWRNRSAVNNTEDSFALFSGGRAMAENLALDQVLRTEDDFANATEEIEALPGISVPEIDWKPLIEGLDPEIDPLADYIPADQHSFFFPDVRSAILMLRESRKEGVPILRILESRAENARIIERYERQMCFTVDKFAEALGPAFVDSVAMTGGDPYWRTGSDVAILLEGRNPNALRTIISGWITATANNRGVEVTAGEIEGIQFMGASSPDRETSAYVARIGNAIVITNSKAQIERLASVQNGAAKPLSSLDEYIFFRNRYPVNSEDETGFMILTDDTIRRWCSAQWRIGASRRIRAAAFMSDLRAEFQDAFISGELADDFSETRTMPLPGNGKVNITSDGLRSPTYGTLEFLTPVAEISIDKISSDEASSYRNWLMRYERGWSQVFDPIAASLSFGPDGIATDITIMPLSRTSDYREMEEFLKGRDLAPEACDPRSPWALQIVASLNRESELFRMTDNIFGQEYRELTSPTAWIGHWAGLYLEESPFLEEFINAENKESFIEENFNRIPLAIQIHVRNPLQFVGFISVLRGFVDLNAPNMTKWETRSHAGLNYVAVEFEVQEELPEKPSICYVSVPGVVTISPSEDVIKSFIERRQATREAGEDDKPEIKRPCLGDHIALKVERSGIEPLTMDIYREAMQRRSWRNIDILNEWKLRYPDLDPLDVHERIWGVRLQCPGGGEYVWNEDMESMVSTAYGHPFAPEKGPGVMEALRDMDRADFGLSFENDGLRARAVFGRKQEDANADNQ